ncbi:flavoprotein [Streptomyces sp. CRN 30]|uniref:flavoprotein n=1 Tax=Streptomyces sp. CRN 30 TaxID=3075613 RepID=UPI002A81661B|nr:flavoprotein [Streptomyces sp. CRN 30]
MRDDALSVIVCGSSAAQLVSAYLIPLRQATDLPLRVLLTHSAERFVRAEALAFCAEELYRSDTPDLNPTEFARRSRALVVLPATAHTLASAALGLAGGPAQTALLAADRPALFFPSMNAAMWDRATTRRHVTTLRGDGHAVVDPVDRDTFELWQRRVTTAPSLPPPETVTKTVTEWIRHD